jgi:hypothetical protein
MAIEVVCDCGKRLKAPDWMAGRSTQCPACWHPVTVPKRRLIDVLGLPSRKKRRKRSTSKKATDSRIEPELSNDAPVLRRSPLADSPFSSSRSLDGLPERELAPKSRRTTFVPARAVTDGNDYRPNSVVLRSQPRWVKLLPKQKEQKWYHSLTFPFGKLPVFFRLGLLQAVLTTAALILWLSMERDNPHQEQFVILLLVCVGGIFCVLGHTFHYFNAILEMACHGHTKHEPGIGCTTLGALVSLGHWLSCFLAGPALLFAAALGYWLYCGDLTIVDWSILAELCFAGVGWWLIALLLTNLDDSMRVASPIQVLHTALSMPSECAGLTLLAAAVFLGHFFVAAYAIGQLHVTPLTAFPLLWVCWSSGFYLTAFTFRRLGLTYYRAQQRTRGRKHVGAIPIAISRHQGGISADGEGERTGVGQRLAPRPE